MKLAHSTSLAVGLVVIVVLFVVGCGSSHAHRFPTERETLDCFRDEGWKIGSGRDPAGDAYVVAPKRFAVPNSGTFSLSYSAEAQGPPPPGLALSFYEAMRSDRKAWATWVGTRHNPPAEAQDTVRKCFLTSVS